MRCFSRGVICSALGSFFDGEDPADGLEVPYMRQTHQHFGNSENVAGKLISKFRAQ